MDIIFQHGEDTYPEECCGVLIASPHRPNVIIESKKMQNINQESKQTRYNIDPLELMKLEDELDGRGLEMVGIYHSHPDHRAEPSDTDLQHAWPNLHYMVFGVRHGRADKVSVWYLDTTQQEFIKEELEYSEDKEEE